MLINAHYTCHLSILIKKEYNNLISLMSQIPQSMRIKKIIDGTGGKVSVADIIAYQIGWGNLLLGWYKTGLQNKIPQMPGEGFTTWHYVEIAQHFYKKYHYDGYKEQEQQFYNIVRQILAITENEFAIGNLDKEGIWKWCTLSSGKQWPLSKWIRVNTVAPFKRAANLIK